MPNPRDTQAVPDEPLLDVRDLRVTFRTRNGLVTAVDGLSFSVMPGEVLGIVGESGSGKSVAVLSLLRLIRDRNMQVTGEVIFSGVDLITMPDQRLRAVRGREIALIFQDALTALTPVYTVGWHIVEQIRAHKPVSKRNARASAVRLLEQVGIPNAERRVDNYPHEFSGGMRQRVLIAMALACNPRLLVADEPTTALDVTTQAQILDLMLELRKEHGSAIIMITHDMGVVYEIADRLLVMYSGRAVEQGPTRSIFRQPRHPYTSGLLGSIPQFTATGAARLQAIPGSPPSPLRVPDGCVFGPRCRFRHAACTEQPRLRGEDDHLDACWLPGEAKDNLRTEALPLAGGESDVGARG